MNKFPALDPDAIVVTRDALHGYARILGDWLKSTRAQRKHWWHASLRPSLYGLTTGVMHSAVDIELELKLNESSLVGRNSNGEQLVEELVGQPASALAVVTATDYSCTIDPKGKYPCRIVVVKCQASRKITVRNP